MLYDLPSPCANCPFRNDRRPYIPAARVQEIRGQVFSCHKTTTARGRSNRHPQARHCAGSLILHEKEGAPHLAMILGRQLGLYDPGKLNMAAPVYATFEEMIEAHRQAPE